MLFHHGMLWLTSDDVDQGREHRWLEVHIKQKSTVGSEYHANVLVSSYDKLFVDLCLPPILYGIIEI